MVAFGSGCTDKTKQNNSTLTSETSSIINPDYGINTGQVDFVENGDNVTVDYTGIFKNGTIFDTSIEQNAKNAGIFNQNRTYEPMIFNVGSNEVIMGFNKGILNMHSGEEKTFTVNASEAYGEDNIPVPTSSLINSNITPAVGMKLITPRGLATIMSVNDTNAILDFDHPLVGQDLTFTVKILSINKGKKT